MNLHHLFNLELTDEDERVLDEVHQQLAAEDTAKRKQARAKAKAKAKANQRTPQDDGDDEPDESESDEGE